VLDDAAYRIGLYHQHLNSIEPRMRAILADAVHDYSIWGWIKGEYEKAFLNTYHADLAAILFYSVMRRLYVETGDSIEYSDDEIRRCVKAQVQQNPNRPVRIYPADSPADVTPQLILRIVDDFNFCAPLGTSRRMRGWRRGFFDRNSKERCIHAALIELKCSNRASFATRLPTCLAGWLPATCSRHWSLSS